MAVFAAAVVLAVFVVETKAEAVYGEQVAGMVDDFVPAAAIVVVATEVNVAVGVNVDADDDVVQ